MRTKSLACMSGTYQNKMQFIKANQNDNKAVSVASSPLSPRPTSQKPASMRKVQRVPYQSKSVVFQEYEYYEDVPAPPSKFQYQQVLACVPIQKRIIQYIAVQTRKGFKQVKCEQKRIQRIPIEKKVMISNYRPVTRVIQHMPQQLKQTIPAQNVLKNRAAADQLILKPPSMQPNFLNKKQIIQDNAGPQLQDRPGFRQFVSGVSTRQISGRSQGSGQIQYLREPVKPYNHIPYDTAPLSPSYHYQPATSPPYPQNQFDKQRYSNNQCNGGPPISQARKSISMRNSVDMRPSQLYQTIEDAIPGVRQQQTTSRRKTQLRAPQERRLIQRPVRPQTLVVSQPQARRFDQTQPVIRTVVRYNSALPQPKIKNNATQQQVYTFKPEIQRQQPVMQKRNDSQNTPLRFAAQKQVQDISFKEEERPVTPVQYLSCYKKVSYEQFVDLLGQFNPSYLQSADNFWKGRGDSQNLAELAGQLQLEHKQLSDFLFEQCR